MILNLRKQMQPDAQPLEGLAALELSARDYPGFRVDAAVDVRYRTAPGRGKATLFIALQARLAALCARCLEPLTRDFRLEKEFVLDAPMLAEEFPELPLDRDGALDLDELVYGELVMEVPPVLLCSEDCEGLCAGCGQRPSRCRCEKQPAGDPRWQVLRQLLSEDSEESE